MTRPDDIALDQEALALPTPEQQAQAVIDRFLDWATDPRLAVLDTETTGLGPGEQVIEIGMVDLEGRPLMNQRVRPTFPVPAGATAIHGITNEDLKDCPTFDQVWPRLWELLQTHRVVVYNGAFDFNRIADSLNAALPGWYQGDGGPSELLQAWNALIPPMQRDGCVMEAYAPLHGEWNAWHGSYRWARLSAACAERGVDTSDLKAHSALDDARATLRLIRAAAQLTPEQLPWIGREDEA